MITELTEEQKKMMPVYVDKWTKIGLSTEPIKDYEETINLFYEKVLNKKRPARIILSSSPLQTREQVEEQVKVSGCKTVDKWALVDVWEIWAQVIRQVKEQVIWQIIEEVQQICDRVEWWPVVILINVVGQIKRQVECRKYNVYPLDGHFRDCDFASYDYFNQVLDIKYPENWSICKRTAELGLIYMLDDVCIVTDRPEQITMKGRLLHNESGMAIKYRDGWGIYALNGVGIAKEIFETPPDKLDPEIILKEANVEVRREIVRKIGIERLEKKLKPHVLDKWGDYELHDYSNHFKRMRCRPVYLKMKNPSIGVWHYEGVNINEMEAPTCQAALKWRLKGKDFKPIRIT